MAIVATSTIWDDKLKTIKQKHFKISRTFYTLLKDLFSYIGLLSLKYFAIPNKKLNCYRLVISTA